MRIAVIAPLVAPLREPECHGSCRVIRDIACGLSARGHRVTVYAAAGSAIAGVRVVTVPVPAPAQAAYSAPGGYSMEAARAMAEAFGRVFALVARDRPDVVSQHAFDAPAIERAAAWPTIHTLHLPPASDHDGGITAALRGWRTAAAAVSRTSAVHWRRVLGQELLVLENGVLGEPPRAGPASRIALIAGRISREKGTATAIRAARALALRPVIVGDVYDRTYFDHEVAPLLDGAIVLGPLHRSALWRWMARAAVVLMPITWDDPFGLVAAEAQLAGCPVAAYRRGALAEIVRDGEGGFLAREGDEAALVVAAHRALALDRAAIQRAARPRFAIEPCLERYERALGAIAGITGAARCAAR